MPTTETKKRTITLTDRAPVQIDPEIWQEIAHGRAHRHDGVIEAQANRTWRCDIRVRMKEEGGPAIVYGVWIYDTHFQGEYGETVKAGYLLDAPGYDLVKIINRTAEKLKEGSEEELAARMIDEARRDVIANLPPVDLDAA